MIVKHHQILKPARTTVTQAELREELIELWAQIFERELRAELGTHVGRSAESAASCVIPSDKLSEDRAAAGPEITGGRR